VADPVIKICGIRSVPHALTSATAGATAIGLMFAPSKRRVELDLALQIVSSLPADAPLKVGVFVNADPVEMLATKRAVGLDILQLSGDESVSILADLDGARVWKALRFAEGTDVESARRLIDPWFTAAIPVEKVLIDAAVRGAYGGTGHRADWHLFSQLMDDYPLVLAGGLNPVNVADAINLAKPAGVDVSSGVETSGHKDPELIHSFVHNAQRAFQ
jgi:phosphoribosylanthranilate isomerase